MNRVWLVWEVYPTFTLLVGVYGTEMGAKHYVSTHQNNANALGMLYHIESWDVE